MFGSQWAGHALLRSEMRMTEPNPSAPAPKKGTAALTVDDYAKWRAGNVTLAELAARCGVSVPAVHKRLKKLSHQPPSKPTPDAIPMVPSDKWMEPDASKPLPLFSDEDARTLAMSAAFSTLVHANHYLTSNAAIAPSVLKMTSVATNAAVDLLVKLGAMALPEPAEKPLPVLKIEVMTEEECAALRSGSGRAENSDED